MLKLIADPTFKAKVGIPVPGKPPAEVEFTFKHRTREELDKFMKETDGREDADIVMDMVTAWGLTDAFTRDNVQLLLSNYIGAPGAITSTYMQELTAHRLGN